MATTRVTFGNTVIKNATCPLGKSAEFIWDTESPGLGLRISRGGAKTYIFQGKVKLTRDVVRIKIGDEKTYAFADARIEARRLKFIIDRGLDPRVVHTNKLAAEQAARDVELAATVAAAALATQHATTFGEVWAAYLAERQPDWGERHYKDHEKKIAPGGIAALRGTRGRGVTIAGPLHYFADLPLIGVDPETIEAWSKREGQTRPTSARLAWRMLKAFFAWCSEDKRYAGLVQHGNPAKTTKSRKALGKVNAKDDNLRKDALPGWFAAVGKLGNPTVRSYLQVLLLLGARPGEVLQMKWANIDWQNKTVTLRDKVKVTRTIPLPPFCASLIAALPRRTDNDFVFASEQAGVGSIGKPHQAHKNACTVAGLQGITLHGLRRSFASLSIPLQIVGGAAMQIQGHAPVSSREKSYEKWPPDVLQTAHFTIEREILKLAGVKFDNVAPVAWGFRVVTAT